MKNWNELTIEELAALTDEQVEMHKKLIYAQNGIKIPIKPKKPETEDVDTKKDLSVYYINGLSNNIYFSSLEEAAKVSEAIKQCKFIGRYDYDKSYSNRYFTQDIYKRDDLFTVTADIMYSETKYNQIKEHLELVERLETQYKNELDEYKNLIERAKDVTSKFINKIEEARTTIARREKLTIEYYKEYLPLAENNGDIAMSFLEKAYYLNDDDKEYILSHTLENVTEF